MTEATVGMLSSLDRAAIKDVSERFAALFAAGDFARLARLYTEDAVVMPPHQPAVHGRAAFEKWIASFPRVSRVTLNNEEIDGRADIAYVRGTYTMTLHPEGAPGPVEDVGKYLEIRKRQPDGSWLLAVDIFNSNRP